MSDRDRVITLLEEQNTLLRAILAALSPDATAARGAAGAVASDRDLDGQYGNPEVRTNPKRWDGPSFRGRRFSECSAEFLDVYAELLEWQGQQSDKKNERTNTNKPLGDYRRQDAARARGWAKRIRAGLVQQAPRGPEPPPPGYSGPLGGPTFEEETGGDFAPSNDFTPNNWRQ